MDISDSLLAYSRIQAADSIPVTIWTNDTKRINVHETTGDTTLETGNLVIGTAGKGSR